MVLLVMPLVLAEKTTVVNTESGISAITIVYPINTIYPEYSNVTVPFDVLDSNFSRQDNTQATCVYAVVNSTGDNIGSGNAHYSSTNGYWSFDICGCMTNSRGEYSFYIYCNTTDEAGFVSEGYSITQNGFKDTENIGLTGLIILIPLIVGLIFVIISAILSDKHAVLKYALIILSVVMAIPAMHMATIVSVEYLDIPALQDTLGFNTYMIGSILFIMFMYFGLYFFVSIIHRINDKKEAELEI